MENQDKKRILSMYQCTGTFTLGNYLGALRNHIKLQEEGYDCVYALADLHALTVRQEPAGLRKYTKEGWTLRRPFSSSRARCPSTASWPGFSTATPSSGSFPA